MQIYWPHSAKTPLRSPFLLIQSGGLSFVGQLLTPTRTKEGRKEGTDERIELFKCVAKRIRHKSQCVCNLPVNRTIQHIRIGKTDSANGLYNTHYPCQVSNFISATICRHSIFTNNWFRCAIGKRTNTERIQHSSPTQTVLLAKRHKLNIIPLNLQWGKITFATHKYTRFDWFVLVFHVRKSFRILSHDTLNDILGR